MTSGSSSVTTAASLLVKIKGALRAVVSDSNARNLMGFLALNFAFAFVELAYGIWTNSLGLISDSFHMFFDCTGLVAGLAAQVVSRWPSDDSFAYGYKRAEVLAGFVNALFLLFIAFFILTEAVERAIEPPEVNHDRLFVVSILGLIVNLIGIYVFQHGGSHGHSHGGGGGHGHSHSGSSGHGHSHGNSNHNHSHDGGHHVTEDPYHHQVSISMGGGHQQNNASAPTMATNQSNHGQNHLMKGVLLHILADTLGSVGVVISALLMRAFGWMRADPVCSIFIAILVAASVWGLLRDSANVLMMRTPIDLDDEKRTLEGCYARLHRYHPAILGIQEPRFWTLCADTYAGSIKIEVRSGIISTVGGASADYNMSLKSQSPSPLQFSNQQQDVQFSAKMLHDRDQFANGLVRYAQQVFGAVGVRHLYVQIDYTTDDTISGGGSSGGHLNQDPHYHNILNDSQRQNHLGSTGSLLDQQQQYQAYNQHFQPQQQQQQQQYANPLLMM